VGHADQRRVVIYRGANRCGVNGDGISRGDQLQPVLPA